MTEYAVRITWPNMNAENAEEAVLDAVELMVAKGMREWIYRVDDSETARANGGVNNDSLVGYFDGWGDPVDHEAIIAQAEAEEAAAAAAGEAAPPGEPEQAINDESDAGLLELAASLNEGDTEK